MSVDEGRHVPVGPRTVAPDAALARPDGRARVLATLRRLGPLSRADLARHAPLAASTVTGLVAGLQAEGLVVELERVAEPGRPGRPGTLLALHRSAGVVVGLDFGKRHLAVAVADLAHELVAERWVALDADLPAARQVEQAHRMVTDALAEAGTGLSEVVGIAAGIPGPVHRPTGHLGDSTILPGWVGVAATEALGAAFGIPVQVDNDANLGALAEWMWGAARDSRHVVYVKLSTGIGGGLIIDGCPFSGSGGTAGEIGHVVVEPGGPRCRCGRRGCLESVTGSALVIDRVRRLHAGVGSVADVLALAAGGDPAALRELAHCGTATGTALGAVCNLLNPGLIVLGGELAAAGPAILDPLTTALRASSLTSTFHDVEVRRASLGERAEVLGAVALSLRGADRTVGAS